jgi:hypothetical protein
MPLSVAPTGHDIEQMYALVFPRVAVLFLVFCAIPAAGLAQLTPAPRGTYPDESGALDDLAFVGALPVDTISGSAAAPGDTLTRDSEWTDPVPNVPRALGGIAFTNVLAVGINVLWRDEPSTNPGSWWDNLQGGWEWDTNPIRVNSFEHPWAGAAYYNVARANGLSFYAAIPATAAGSVMWELFGEPRPPSTNDVLTTTLGGIALGEPLHRMSLIVLDNQASGFNRFWREAVVFVFNPGLGLDRLSRGQLWNKGANPPGHNPQVLAGQVEMGAVRLTPGGGSPAQPADAAILRFGLQYGDPFNEEKISPFSSFSGTVEMSSLSAVLTQLGARGIITAIGKKEGPTDRVLGVFLDFDYRWDGRVGFAEQSLGLGLLSRFGDERWRVKTDLSAELVPLLASTDRWARPATERYYEFGSGLGGRAVAQLEHHGRRLVFGSLRAYWSATLDGASSSKLIQIAEIEARTPPIGPLSLGANYRLYRQSSRYDDRRTGNESMSSFSIFLSSGG